VIKGPDVGNFDDNKLAEMVKGYAESKVKRATTSDEQGTCRL